VPAWNPFHAKSSNLACCMHRACRPACRPACKTCMHGACSMQACMQQCKLHADEISSLQSGTPTRDREKSDPILIRSVDFMRHLW
jgi:hypothetical protein